jgi:membrane-associated protease RseP (regulator of RpoE activity)
MTALPPQPEPSRPAALSNRTFEILAGQFYQPPQRSQLMNASAASAPIAAEEQPARMPVVVPSANVRLPEPRRRRRGLPILLFVATCVSTFFVGVSAWNPEPYLMSTTAAWQQIENNWPNGLLYSVALLGILMTHEMGHFLVTLRYHIPASYPLFIPVPIHPVGTLGAVIGMDGLKANRREIFDLGLSGPVAGLLIALPVLWFGIERLDLSGPPGEVQFHNPLIGKLMMAQLHPEWAERTIGFEQLNPLFMAGWVGMLITGLNMLPISQLDGGHVLHALFTRRAKLIARTFLMGAIYCVVAYEAYNWVLMLIIVTFIGTDHPPSSNDDMPLGPLRWLLGLASLAIPIFCFAPMGIEM